MSAVVCKRPLCIDELAGRVFAKRLRQTYVAGSAPPAFVPSSSSRFGQRPPTVVAPHPSVEKRPADEVTEMKPTAPKRLCLAVEPMPPNWSADGSAASCAAATARDDIVTRGAVSIVRALHGCPSIEEASRRCISVAADFYDAGLQQAVTDISAHTSDSQDGCGEHGGLPCADRILLRAVRYLIARCRSLEAEGDDAAQVRAALEVCQGQLRREAHMNSMLQEQVRMSLDGPAVKMQGFHVLH